MLKKNFLMSPGPSKVPESVMLEMAQPVFHHRTPQYQEIFADVTAKLKQVFRTKNDVFVFTSSGTGAMEASVTSFLSAGDTVLTIDMGKFSQRFDLIAKAYGINTKKIDVEWGKAVDPSVVEAALAEDPSIKAVYSTLTETSTGVVVDLKALGAVVAKTSAILVADAISGLGADKIETDEWGVDVVVAGSQKALMLPPGLAFMSVSEKAYQLAENSSIPAFYFDLSRSKKALDKNDTPFTPAITLVIGLQKSLDMILSEGMEEVWARHEKLAVATRAAVKAIGLSILSDSPSNAVSAVQFPEGVDGGKFAKIIRDEKGVTMAGGQDHLKGKIFRIAHMGYCNQYDMVVGLAAVEEVLYELNFKFDKGAALKAFQETYLS